MKREDVEKLLGWAREAQKVFEESGETDFEELRRREQREIYDRFAGSGFDVHDGSIDKYTGYEKVEIGDLTARFYFHDESNYPFDMLLFIGEDCVPVQEFVQWYSGKQDGIWSRRGVAGSAGRSNLHRIGFDRTGRAGSQGSVYRGRAGKG